jgi:SNF2 family DNA or RNA helicase
MSDFVAINNDEFSFLYGLALFEGPMHQKGMLLLLNLYGQLTKSEVSLELNHVRDHYSNLFEKGYLDFKSGQGYALKENMQLAVLAHLMSNADIKIWVKSVRLLLNLYGDYQNWKAQNVSFCRREMMLSLLEGDINSLQEWRSRFYLTNHADAISLGNIFFANNNGKELFSQLAPNCQTVILSDVFQESNWFLKDCQYAFEYTKKNIQALDFENQEFMNHYSWQLILRGDYKNASALLNKASTQIANQIQSVLTLQGGNYSTSLQFIEAYLQEYKLKTGKRKIFLSDILGLFYLVILLANKTSIQIARAKDQVDEGVKQKDAYSYFLMQSLVNHLALGVPLNTSLSSHSHQFSDEVSIDKFFIGLSQLWESKIIHEEAKAQLLATQSQAFKNGYIWVAEEINQLLEINTANEINGKSWHNTQHLKPLKHAYQMVESWKVSLGALSALSNETKKVKVTQKKEEKMRLVWNVELFHDNLYLEPREQKHSEKGHWSKGRAIALKRLLNEKDSLLYLTEQDKRIISCIQKDHQYMGTEYCFNVDKAVVQLIGHPAVFLSDTNDIKVDIVEGEISLQLHEIDQQIQLKLTPTLNEHHDVFLVQETPTKILVYTVNVEIKKIVSIIGSGLTVPLEAKAQLVEVISAVAPHLTIHSNLPELNQHIQTLPACTTVFAHLLPIRDGLRLQFLVRPMTDGSWYSAGSGAENIISENDGIAIQVIRDLQKELDNLENIIQQCPALLNSIETIKNTNTNANQHEWQIDHPENCLEVLSQLKCLEGEHLQLVWPEGEKFRIKARGAASDLHLSIKKQGDWLHAGGELQLDDGRIIALRELIQLSSSSKSRFLKIADDDYIALTESLRSRLNELHHLGEFVGKDGIRLSHLSSSSLQDLSLEVGQVESDQAWKTHLEKLDAMTHFEPVLPSTLQAELRDYQLDGFQWLSRLAHWGIGACLADDMGLGKTIQTLALLISRAPQGPALVIAPVSVIMNWQTEAHRFAPTLKVHVYHQNRANKVLVELGAYDVVIASYGMLQQDNDFFKAQYWHSVVLDEAQAIKNSSTKRSQAAMSLQADFKMIVSGTPVENHLGELWNLFRFINPGLLGSKERFNEKFILPIERGNKEAKAHLKRLIQAFILRRTKSQVLSELPSRTEVTLQVELSDQERHLYEAMRQEAMDRVDSLDPEKGKSMQVLAEITKLRRFCCHPQLVLKNTGMGMKIKSSKLLVFAETLDEILVNRHKTLVFSQFVDHLSIIRQHLEDQGISYQYLDGSTPIEDRKKRVDAFQTGQGDVFLISLKAGGSGLNLTAADYVIHLDPWWNPAVEDQASDRAHRMGQTRPVTIYRLVTQNTIEEKMIALHAVKRDLADSLLEGGELNASLKTQDLMLLLKNESTN